MSQAIGNLPLTLIHLLLTGGLIYMPMVSHPWQALDNSFGVFPLPGTSLVLLVGFVKVGYSYIFAIYTFFKPARCLFGLVLRNLKLGYQ